MSWRICDSNTASGDKEEEEEARKKREAITALQLVGELQRLFAYMALSKRRMIGTCKYVCMYVYYYLCMYVCM